LLVSSYLSIVIEKKRRRARKKFSGNSLSLFRGERKGKTRISLKPSSPFAGDWAAEGGRSINFFRYA